MMAALLAALAASPLLAIAASPAPGSPLDSSDVLVVSDSSATTVGTYFMARDAAGDFVMVWEQQASSFPNAITLHVQRFDAAGQPQGAAFQVAASEVEPGIPAVAMDAAGDFVVAWQSTGAPYQQTATYDVHAQRYDAKGTAQGAEFLVSTAANFDDINPSVALDAGGDLVVVWQGEPSPGGVPEPSDAYQIYARRYSSAGTALGDQFLVSAAPDTNQTWPSVAMDAAGDFVAAWQTGDHQNLGYLDWDIVAQRYDAAGVAQGGAFALSTAANTGRNSPRVAMTASGRFVVTWINYAASVQPTTGDIVGDVHAQRFDAKGTPQGSELAVNTFTAGDQSSPSVTMDAGGKFAVVWQSNDQVAADSGYDIYAQRYSAAGASVGVESLVNTLTAGSQFEPIAAMDADGDMVVAWGSSSAGSSIYIRRFAGEESMNLKVRSTFAPVTPSPSSNFSMTLAVDNASATTPTGASGVDAALGLGLGVTADITLPTGVIYQSAQGSDWTCTGPANAALNCSYGAPLAAGSAAPPLTVMLTAPSTSGSLDFSASVSSTLKPVTSQSVDSSVTIQAAGSGSGSSGGAAAGGGNSGGSSSGGGSSGGSSGGGSTGGGDPGKMISGKGTLDSLSLALLGLLLLGRWRTKA